MTALQRLLKGSVLPVLVWLVGLGLFATLGIGGLFAGDNPVFLVARLTAYVTVGTVAAMTLAFAAMFGVACGLMLEWLGESPKPGSIATAMGRSFWGVAGYTWFGVALSVVKPPLALTTFDMVDPGMFQAHVEDTIVFAWMARLRHVPVAGFLVLATWFLARDAKPWNAVISVAFGAAALAALSAGLGLLAGSEPV